MKTWHTSSWLAGGVGSLKLVRTSSSSDGKVARYWWSVLKLERFLAKIHFSSSSNAPLIARSRWPCSRQTKANPKSRARVRSSPFCPCLIYVDDASPRWIALPLRRSGIGRCASGQASSRRGSCRRDGDLGGLGALRVLSADNSPPRRVFPKLRRGRRS